MRIHDLHGYIKKFRSGTILVVGDLILDQYIWGPVSRISPEAPVPVVEVTGEAPLIDTTTSHTVTNITPDVVAEVPHGISYQSVIQFAPSARNVAT